MPDNVTVSEKPWSDYSEADYTPEQWHAACLIHQHEGAPTAKSQCKLPVRTPNGTLNRNGVHAAAAALAGARGGVDATPAEKSAAARAIVRLYGQLDEKAPPSMMALMHQEEVDAFLAHFGVKGMKWGVRKSEPSAAQQLRAKVKAGEGTVGEAHQAALKSTGHRAANFFLGDKTYWKRAAEVTGITLAEVAIVSIPGLLPTAALAGVAIGIGAASNTAAAGITLANFHRAIFGNRKITKSMENLGKDARRRQKNADEKTKKLLNKYGSIPKKSFEHSETFLAHADSTQTVQEVWDSLSPAQLDTMETLIGLALDESNAEGVVIDTDVYNSMSDIQKTVATFIMAGALSNAEGAAKHADVDEFLAHFGIKGMKWGVRREETGPWGSGKPVSKEEASAHNAISDQISKSIKSAKTEAEVEGVLDQAYKSGHMEGNVKLHNTENTSNGKKVRYEISVYRLTPGKPNMHAGDGTKIEHILKEVKSSPAVIGPDGNLEYQHSESLLDNFLAHYGVKGMKWGVRRGDNASGGSKSKSSSPSKKEVKIAEANKNTQVSVDAERFVRTRMKAQHEMSDREIREAVQRAEWVKKYDAAFNPDANAQLQAKVNQMRLQKDYASLSRELNPTKMDRVNNFITKADSAFQSYQHINELSGGVLNATLAKSMGLTKPESPYERLLRENKILSAEKEHSNLLRDLNEPQSQRNLFPKHSSGTQVGRHQLELPGKHRA